MTETKIQEIIKMYEEDNFTLDKIAKIINSTKRTVSNILKKNGIKIKRYKRIYAKYYDQTLSKRQKEVLIGSLLGDGGIYKHHEGINSCRYSGTHSINQIDYVLWKIKELENFISCKYRIIDNSKNNSFSITSSVAYQTVLHYEFSILHNMFYPDGYKIIPKDIIDYLTPLGLAVWYMDDGSVHYVSNRAVARFHTQSFLKDDILILIEMLKIKFNIVARIVNTKKGIVLQLCQTETSKLFEIIKDFILPSMSYKIRSYNNP